MKELYLANEELINRLNESISKNTVFHACIIQSRYQEDRETFAKDYVKGILSHKDIGDHSNSRICNKVEEEKHEDVIMIRRKKSNVSVEDIRNMQKRIAIKPFGDRYAVIVAEGDHMDAISQNTLLKTLEEPPGDTVILILCEDVENLLPTIRSRCVVYSLETGSKEDDSQIREIAENVIDLALRGAPYYRMNRITGPIEQDRDKLREFIDIAEEICRDRLFERNEKGIPYNQEKTGNDIHALEEARRKLARGMTSRYILKELLLKIGG